MPYEAWGFKSPLRHRRRPTQQAHIQDTNPTKIATCETPSFPPEHQQDTSEHPSDIFLRSEHVICMSDLPEDLATVVAAWESLPEAVKAGIVAMVNVARRSEQ